MRKRLAMRTSILLAALLAAPALAKPPSVQVTGAWARATAPGQHRTVAYMTLTSPSADQLTGVTSPAGRAMLHSMTMSGDVMRMRPMASLALPAGTPVRLAPGGAHVMLTRLGVPLAAGQSVPLTLHFAKAAPETVTLPVLPLGATGP